MTEANGRWRNFRDIWFDYDRAEIRPSETAKINEIAAYMRANPNVQFGLDSTMAANGRDPKNAELAKRRHEAVRAALVRAGVPAAQIRDGELGDPQARQDRRVEVLVVNK